MTIQYSTSRIPTTQQVIALFNDAGLPRPTGDAGRIGKMIANADLIVTAWDGEALAGIARSITDWVWCCYLSDLAVGSAYKKSGVGKRLIEITREKIGDQSMLLLLSVPTAMDYYPKVGFERQQSSFIINRLK